MLNIDESHFLFADRWLGYTVFGCYLCVCALFAQQASAKRWYGHAINERKTHLNLFFFLRRCSASLSIAALLDLEFVSLAQAYANKLFRFDFCEKVNISSCASSVWLQLLLATVDFCSQSIPHRFSRSIKSIGSSIALFGYCLHNCAKLQPEVSPHRDRNANWKICVMLALELLNDFVQFIRFYSNWRLRAISCFKQMSMFFFHPRFFALSRWNYRIPQRPYNIFLHPFLLKWNHSFQIEYRCEHARREETTHDLCVYSPYQPHPINCAFSWMRDEIPSTRKSVDEEGGARKKN